MNKQRHPVQINPKAVSGAAGIILFLIFWKEILTVALIAGAVYLCWHYRRQIAVIFTAIEKKIESKFNH